MRPAPMFSWRSSFEPSPALESFRWKAASRPRPTARSNSREHGGEAAAACGCRIRPRTGGRCPRRAPGAPAGATRARIAPSSSAREPRALPAPAVFSRATRTLHPSVRRATSSSAPTSAVQSRLGAGAPVGARVQDDEGQAEALGALEVVHEGGHGPRSLVRIRRGQIDEVVRVRARGPQPGRGQRPAGTRAASASSSRRPAHRSWFLTKIWTTPHPAATPRRIAFGSPPAIDMCAPRLSGRGGAPGRRRSAGLSRASSPRRGSSPDPAAGPGRSAPRTGRHPARRSRTSRDGTR